MRFFYYTALLIFPSVLHAADADLVLRNGRLWTGDPQNPWAEALAIDGNKIVEVGSNAALAQRTGAKTQVIDLKGRLGSPGFNDAHVHFLSGSLSLFQVSLWEAGSLEEMQCRIAAFAKTHPQEKWIGVGWEYGWFPDHRLPTKEDIDKVVSDRPVYLKGYDGHTAWVNSEALRLADINASIALSPAKPSMVNPKAAGFPINASASKRRCALTP